MQYTIAMLGYADEDKTTVLELTYNYGRTEYSKGNAYAQVCMESDGQFCMLLNITYIRSSWCSPFLVAILSLSNMTAAGSNSSKLWEYVSASAIIEVWSS